MLNIEQLKKDLATAKQAIDSLTSAGIAIPVVLQQQYDKISKQLSGNNSQQTADLFNDKLAALWTNPKNAEFVTAITKLAGESGVRIKLIVTEGLVKFEAAGSGAAGGSKPGAGAGGTRAESEFNQWVVNVLDTNPVADKYAEKTGTFGSAANAVAFILNGGTNPLSKGAEYGKGNSMVRVLKGLQNEEAFKTSFTVTPSKVEKTATPAEPKA